MREESVRRRWPWWLAAALVFAGVVAGLRTRAAWDGACTLARRQLPALLNAEVGIGRCELDPLTQTVRLHGVSAQDRAGRAERPFLAADLVEVQLSSVQPIFGTVELGRVRVHRPRLFLDLTLPPLPTERTAGAKPVRPAAPRCPLDTLKRVEVSRLDIEDAELRVRWPNGRALELVGLDAGWRTRRGVAELNVQLSEGFLAPGGEARVLTIGRARIEGGLDVDGETLSLATAELDVEDATVSITGTLEELCSPRLGLDVQAFLPLKTVARAAGLSQHVAGHAWTRVQLSGTVKEPAVTIDVAGTGVEFGRYRPGDFTAAASLTGDEVRFHEVTLSVGAGTVKANGRLGLTPSFPLSLRATAENASLGRALERVGMPGAWVDLVASGRGSASGQLRPAIQLDGSAELELANFIVASRPFDGPRDKGRTLLQFERGSLKTDVRVLRDRVELSSAEVRSGRSELAADATLFFDPDRGLDIDGRLKVLDLDDFKHVAGLAFAGTGSAQVRVAGPYRDVKIDGSAAVRDFMFWDFALGVVEAKVAYGNRTLSFPSITGQKGKTTYSGSATLGFGKRETEVDARLQLAGMRMADGKRSDAQLADVIDMIVGLHSSIDVFQGTVAGRIPSSELRIKGPTSKFAGPIRLALEDVTYYGRPLGDGHAHLAFVDGDKFNLDSFRLDGAVGALRAQGAWKFKESLEYTFSGDNLSVAEVVGPERAERLGISGAMRLRGKVGGDTDLPIVEGELTSEGVALAKRDLGTTALNFELRGRQLEVWNKLSDAATFRGPAKLTVRAPYPYEATLQVALPQIRPCLPERAAQQGVSGSVAGVVHARGQLSGGGATELDAVLDTIRLARGDFRVENDGPVKVAYLDGAVTVEPFLVRGPNTQFSGAGSWGDGRVDARAQGSVDMRLIESFVGSIERTSGTLELTFAATGRTDQPILAGNAQIKNAGFTYRHKPVTVRALSGEVEFSERGVVLQELHGILNDGRLSAHGNLQVDNTGLRAMDLTAQLEQVFYPFDEDLPLNASGQLELQGNLSRLNVSGSIDVTNVRYEKPLVLEAFLRDIGRPTVYYAPGEKPEEWLFFRDLNVTLLDVRVDNNLAKASFERKSQLKVTGNNARLGLLGVVETAEGSQAFFRNNTYEVRRGVIEFRERESIDSVFDLQLETQVREYLVKVHAFGRTRDPKVILSSDPPLPEGDIVALLTLGVTSRDRSDAAGVAATYLAADAFLAASGLDRQVQRFLPKNQLLINPQVHIATSYNESSGQVEPLASLESRLLSQQLKLGMTRPFSGRGTKVNLEWQLEDRLSAQAQWDENSEAKSPFGNIGLDLKYRWEVE